MRLYVIRHGQTDENLIKHSYYFNDVDLNNEGINQVLLTKQKLSNIKFDIILASPFLRTMHTAEIINESINKTIIVDERIIERNEGRFKANPKVDKEIFSWNFYEADSKNVETLKSMFNRVEEFINEIRITYKDKTVLIVTHNGICRIISCYFNGIPQNR